MKFEKLWRKHQELRERIDTSQTASKELLSDIRSFINEARRSGKDIDDVRQRDHLRAFLRFWAGIVYNVQGVYPATDLYPFNGEAVDASSEVSEPPSQTADALSKVPGVVPSPKLQGWANQILHWLMLDQKIGSDLIGLAEEDRRNGDWPQAVKYFRQDLDSLDSELSNEADYTRGVARMYLGADHYAKGEFDKAIEYYQHSEELFGREAYKHGQGVALLALGLAYRAQDAKARALESFEQSCKIFRELSTRYAAIRDYRRETQSKYLCQTVEILKETIFDPSLVYLIPLGETIAGEPIYMVSDHIAIMTVASEIVLDGEKYELLSPYKRVPDKVPFNPCDIYFAPKVRGDSMIEAQIDKGDVILVRIQSTAEQREIVVAQIDEIDGLTTAVKRFWRDKDHIRLESENPYYPPLEFTKDSSEIEILGKVVAILKRVDDA